VTLRELSGCQALLLAVFYPAAFEEYLAELGFRAGF
jgi:hypothetical protein